MKTDSPIVTLFKKKQSNLILVVCGEKARTNHEKLLVVACILSMRHSQKSSGVESLRRPFTIIAKMKSCEVSIVLDQFSIKRKDGNNVKSHSRSVLNSFVIPKTNKIEIVSRNECRNMHTLSIMFGHLVFIR